MQRLREMSRGPLNNRSIWEACGKRKVIAVLLLSSWAGTSSTTPVGWPNDVRQANTDKVSFPTNADLSQSLVNNGQRTESAPIQAEVSRIQREITNQPAQLAESNAADDLMCLALNIYWEARSQSSAGQLAVAQVTLNRVLDPRYGDNVCDVVYEHKQFSWYWDGKPDVPLENNAWQRAILIASAALDGSGHVQLQGVTHYHAIYVKPYWKDYMVKVARIESHIFYVN